MRDGLEVDKYHTKRWWKDGALHRIDGPAVEYTDGSASWYLNGERHRIDGPAYIYIGKFQLWYYQGVKINCSSQKGFERILNLKAFW